jgi:hypothetical protein
MILIEPGWHICVSAYRLTLVHILQACGISPLPQIPVLGRLGDLTRARAERLTNSNHLGMGLESLQLAAIIMRARVSLRRDRIRLPKSEHR